jgi:MerC mercury resistance protein
MSSEAEIEMTVRLQSQQIYDGLAIGGSLLCLAHCLLLPALIVLLPTLAAFLAVPEVFHLWALAFAVPTSALALAAGHRRHRSLMPFLIVAPGVLLLTLGALVAEAEWVETSLTVVGATLLSIGHALNWLALRRAAIPAALCEAARP